MRNPGNERVKLKQETMQIGSARIFYQVSGTGRPVVLVHGLSGSSRWWQKNIEALSQQFRLYLIDLVGFGRSRGRNGFDLEEAPLHLKQWMDRLEIQPAGVIGHSMGGLVVTHLAVDFPEVVERLVLVDAVGMPFGHGLPRQVFNMAHDILLMSLDLKRIILVDAFRAGIINVLAVGQELLDQDTRPLLAHIAAPTLVIWGERDNIVPLGLGEKMTSHLLDSRLVVLPGVGHVPHWENPAAFNRVVADFLTAR